MIYKDCETCEEPTKTVESFWDGEDISGCIYTCDNLTCDIRRLKLADAKKRELRRADIADINKRNGITAAQLRKYMVDNKLLIGAFAKVLGISSSELSAYRQETLPIPKWLIEKVKTEGNS